MLRLKELRRLGDFDASGNPEVKVSLASCGIPEMGWLGVKWLATRSTWG